MQCNIDELTNLYESSSKTFRDRDVEAYLETKRKEIERIISRRKAIILKFLNTCKPILRINSSVAFFNLQNVQSEFFSGKVRFWKRIGTNFAVEIKIVLFKMLRLKTIPR